MKAKSNKKKKLVQEFGNEALHRLSCDLDALCEITTGDESVSVQNLPLYNGDTLLLLQAVHGVEQTILVSEKALPVFVKKLQPVLKSFGYTVTKEKSK